MNFNVPIMIVGNQTKRKIYINLENKTNGKKIEIKKTNICKNTELVIVDNQNQLEMVEISFIDCKIENLDLSDKKFKVVNIKNCQIEQKLKLNNQQPFWTTNINKIFL